MWISVFNWLTHSNQLLNTLFFICLYQVVFVLTKTQYISNIIFCVTLLLKFTTSIISISLMHTRFLEHAIIMQNQFLVVIFCTDIWSIILSVLLISLFCLCVEIRIISFYWWTQQYMTWACCLTLGHWTGLFHIDNSYFPSSLVQR